MVFRRLTLAVAFALGLFATIHVSAQSTGGSFGGGSWGGSESSSGGSSYGSSGSGYSGVSYDDPNAYEPSFGVQCLISVVFLGGLFWLFRQLGKDRRTVDVTMVQIALDARARRFVQDALRALGERGDTATSAGRSALLGATITALRNAKLAWIYAGTRNFPPMPIGRAQNEFTRLANDARAGYREELLRAADGAKATASASALQAREHEGEGAVLVTVIAAAWGALPDVSPDQAEKLDAHLAQLGALPAARLVAMEVVWTPAAENDRMSSDELEKHYPSLTRLPGAVGGRVFCSYCGGPHTAELAQCPHCGAPTASAPDQSPPRS